MAKFKKEILKSGIYQSPDGEIHITEDRINKWVSNFDRMKIAGLKIPLPWGHNSRGQPLSSDEKEFLESKYNAGYVESFSNENGSLVALVDVPRLEDSSRVGTIVQEVSPQIETAWKDGKGKTWTDVITHLALVTHPVVAGQPNFVEIIEDSKLPAFAMRLSLKDYKSQDKDNSDKDTKDKDNSDKNNSDKNNSDKDNKNKKEDNMEEEDKDKKEKTEPEGTKSKETPSGGNSSELLDLLAEIGLVLPDDIEVPEGPFKDCLMTAALTMKHKLEELDGEDDPLANLELPQEGDKGGNPLEGLNAQTPPPVPEQAPKEEQPTMAMSLSTNKDKEPVKPQEITLDENTKTRMSLYEKKIEESDRKSMLSDIEVLLRSGKITPVVANKLKSGVQKYRMSLSDENSPIQDQIETFKLLPEGHAWSDNDKVRLRNATEEALPSEFSQMSEEDAEKLADLQIKRAGKGGLSLSL